MKCAMCGKETLVRYKDPLERETVFCSPGCIKAYSGHEHEHWTVICECGYKTRDRDQMHRHLERYCRLTIASRCSLEHPHAGKHRYVKEVLQ